MTWREPDWKFVEIRWHDAASADDNWVHAEDLPGPAHVITRGWLVKEAPDHIVTAGTYISEKDGKWTFGDVCVIPTGMIKGRKVIRA